MKKLILISLFTCVAAFSFSDVIVDFESIQRLRNNEINNIFVNNKLLSVKTEETTFWRGMPNSKNTNVITFNNEQFAIFDKATNNRLVYTDGQLWRVINNRRERIRTRNVLSGNIFTNWWDILNSENLYDITLIGSMYHIRVSDQRFRNVSIVLDSDHNMMQMSVENDEGVFHFNVNAYIRLQHYPVYFPKESFIYHNNLLIRRVQVLEFKVVDYSPTYFYTNHYRRRTFFNSFADFFRNLR
ncbi:MAG: hypothetical protein FWC64_06075 [Treponema sp.]|nr:hypothetical protein [Treponema sp.]